MSEPTPAQQAVALADVLEAKYGTEGAIRRCQQHCRVPAATGLVARVQARYADAQAILEQRQPREETLPTPDHDG